MEAIDEIVAEFLVESHENLDQLDRDLLALEQDPTSRDLLAGVFRTIHTIKGTSGFLAFNHLEKLTHVGENLLSRLRDGRIALTEERTSALLTMVDAIRSLLSDIERTGAEGQADHSALIETLGALVEDGPAGAVPKPRADTEASTSTDAGTDISTAEAAEGEVPLAAEVTPEPVNTAPASPAPSPAPSVPAPAVPAPSVPAPSAPASSAPAAETPEHTEAGDGRRSVVESSVRVDVDLLDTLMRMVGELVLARNQLVSELDSQKDTALARSAQRLSLVTSELQEQVMKTRMQPVDAAWSKLPRVVRDLSRQLGRQLKLVMQGADTELDRTILEAIKDPLTHLVRNAIDHGIEPPEIRVAAGKPAEGTLTLRAYHEAGQVHLEISDDGKGIDPDVIGAKAVERNLITATQLAGMSVREINQLIFFAGFSTAGQITNVSGRGVGMDVVKTRIESIGGSVDVISRPGFGSTFRLTIPLTLAIIPALTIGCAGRRYAVPQVSVLELVRLNGEHARGGIELISGAPVYRLRGTLMPLVRLDEQLALVPADAVHVTSQDEHDERGSFIVVLQAEQQRFGLVVDDVLDTQEIVVKPLGRHLKNVPLYAGATILGDGSVVLILDAATLARRADVLSSVAGQKSSADSGLAQALDPILVVELAGGRRAAIPLDVVTRLEEIPRASIEQVGGREVVQYRGHIMPLVRLNNLLGAYGETVSEHDTEQLVVYTRGDRSVGFVVDRILDIATEHPGTRSDIDGNALIGSVVVGERVVELLDVESAVLSADPVFFNQPDSSAPIHGEFLQEMTV